MKFNQRFYRGNSFRPTPVIDELNRRGLVICNSWAGKEHADQVIQLVKEQVSSNLESSSLDKIFQKTNETCLQLWNSQELTAGVECLALEINGRILSWIQVGGFHLYLLTGEGSFPLVSDYDLSWQYNQEASLPQRLLGVDEKPYVQTGTVHLPPNAKLVFLSHRNHPTSIVKSEENDLESLAKKIISEYPLRPFWIAELTGAPL